MFTLGLLMLTFLFTGCISAGGVFKAGVWTTIIVIALIVILILFIWSKFSGKNK